MSDPEIIDILKTALEWIARNASHHPTCKAPRNGGEGCTCHVARARAALEATKQE